jgi:hypothetical protein
MVVTRADTALTAVISRLTDRDRYLCRMLADHDVLTSRQLCQIAFSGERRTRNRLAELDGLHVIDRIRPHTPASSRPMHSLLGVAGAHIVAADTAVAVDVLLRRRHCPMGADSRHGCANARTASTYLRTDGDGRARVRVRAEAVSTGTRASHSPARNEEINLMKTNAQLTGAAVPATARSRETVVRSCARR